MYAPIRTPRSGTARRFLLSLVLALALLAPVRAFAVFCVTTVTHYYLLGYEVWSSTSQTCYAEH
jgi:hypothetical protein